jgi:hypothetical protein
MSQGFSASVEAIDRLATSDRKIGMDVRLPFMGMSLGVMLLVGCSPSEEKKQVSLEDKTTKFEQSLDAIKDEKLKDAVAELGGSLLLLERAQLKLQSKPLETQYGSDAMALLKHYPTPQALVDTYIGVSVPPWPGVAVGHAEQQTGNPVPAGMVGDRPRHPAQPF